MGMGTGRVYCDLQETRMGMGWVSVTYLNPYPYSVPVEPYPY
jgi:hypothetical protein